jgi:hypothetical protein
MHSWVGLQKLAVEQVPEGPELDYKLRAYDDPGKPKDQRNDELRKDVTALANAVGGVIVCGISDTNGLPGKVIGVTGNPRADRGEPRLRDSKSHLATVGRRRDPRCGTPRIRRRLRPHSRTLVAARPPCHVWRNAPRLPGTR